MATHYIDAVLRLQDKMTRPLMNASNQMEKTSRKLKAQGRTLKSTGRTLQSVGGTMTKYLTLPIVALGVASGKAYTDFNAAMAKVSTIADTSKVPLKTLESQILRLSNQTGVSASSISEDVYQAISAGQKTEDAVKFVGTATRLSKAGFTDSASALDILTTTMNSYGLKAKEVTKVSDMLLITQNLGKTTVDELAQTMGKVIPTARSYGVKLADLNSGYVTLTKNGIKTRYATTYMNSMYNELGKSGTKVAGILKNQTGKSFDELMKSGKNTGDVLGILQKYCDKTGTKFNDLWTNANSSKAANVFVQQSKDYQDAMKAMSKSAGTTGKAFEKMEGTTTEKFNRAKTRMTNALIQIGAPVMQILAPIVEKLGKYAQKIQGWMASLTPGQQKLVVKTLAIVAAIGPLISIAGKLTSTVGSVMAHVGGMGKTLGAVGGVLGKLSPHMLMFIGIATAVAIAAVVIYKNWDKIAPVLKKVGKWFANTYKSIAGTVNKIIAKVTSMKNKFLEKIQELKDGIKEKFNAIVNFFKNLPGKVKSALTGLPAAIKKAFHIPSLHLPKSWKIGSNARGTNNWRGGLTQINERGGEILDLPQGTRVIPNDISKRMADNTTGRSIKMTITKLADTLVVREDADIDKIADKLYDRFSQVLDNVPT